MGVKSMRSIFVAAGAMALAFAGPALSKPGNGHGYGHEGYGHAYGREGYGHAYGRQGPIGYGVGGCPPGLAKKLNGCMPPGQAKKFLRGQHLSSSFGTRYAHRQILPRRLHSPKRHAD